MTNPNEKIQIESPEIDLSNIKIPDSAFADTLKSIQPPPAQILAQAVGTFAGGYLGYRAAKSMEGGFWSRAFFTVAGASVGSAAVGYATSFFGKDTAD